MTLRNQLCDIHISRSNTVASYFMMISQLRDQLKAIGENIVELKLVIVTFKELSNAWDSFISSIYGRIENSKFD